MEEARAEVARRQAEQAPPPEEFPRPWVDAPAPGSVLQACSVMQRLSVRQKGWKIVAARCTPETLTIDWSVSGGRFSDLPRNAQLSNDDPKRASSIFRQSPLPAREGESVALWSVARIRGYMFDLARLGGQLQVSVIPKAPLVRKVGNTAEPSPHLRVDFEISGLPVFPDWLGDYLSRVPAAQVESVEFNTVNGLWSVRGGFYAKTSTS